MYMPVTRSVSAMVATGFLAKTRPKPLKSSLRRGAKRDYTTPRAAQAVPSTRRAPGGIDRDNSLVARSGHRRRGRPRSRRPGRRRGCTAPTTRRSSRARRSPRAPSPRSRAAPPSPNSPARSPSARPARRDSSVDLGVELARRLPERAERALPAGVIPDACCDAPAFARHARHLAQPRDGIGHEVDDELGQGGVERPVRETAAAPPRRAARRRRDGAPRAAATNGSDGSTAATAAGAEPGDELGRQRARARSRHRARAARPRHPRSRRAAARAGPSSGP